VEFFLEEFLQCFVDSVEKQFTDQYLAALFVDKIVDNVDRIFNNNEIL
jgi:hypothetical protein